MTLASAYDTAAPSFDRHRALPHGVAESIRRSVLGAVHESARPCILDVGAGTGRIGHVFTAAGDDYVGVDLSFGMLREFAARAGPCKSHLPRLLQGDGERLPFRDATFDAVLLIQIVGGARSWQRVVTEACRVLRRPGALVIGRLGMPLNGLDVRMKQHLASVLNDLGAAPYHLNFRNDMQDSLASVACSRTHLIAAKWYAERTPRSFLARQPTGAQFSKLPDRVKRQALRRLRGWAITTFGSLDTVFRERHAFELDVFKFQQAVER